ncbi:MAG: DUF3014 domain-containing protein [Steroidobacteraceae bacterium]|nr:DUF3014 domain-containing protein [Steroidobacteraceae bacterium]
MNENIKWVACAVGVVGLSIGAVIYRDKWWNDKPAPPAKPVATVQEKPVIPAPTTEPAVRHPIPAVDVDQALPSLDSSDVPVQTSIAELLGLEAAKQFVSPENLVRNIVVSIDNLPEQKVAERIRPLQRVPGTFAVGGPEDAPVLDPANYERYKPLVQSIHSLDTQRLVATYQRFYPLFQESYEGLGSGPKYFNDRLIEVIDHLLETPEVREPIALARPSVQYEFADPKLESLSAGQKLLIRMGSENAATVKTKLREVRGAIVGSPESR